MSFFCRWELGVRIQSDRLGKTRLERWLVEPLAALARLQQCQEIGRARQAADMGGQDAVSAQLHDLALLLTPRFSPARIVSCGRAGRKDMSRRNPRNKNPELAYT